MSSCGISAERVRGVRFVTWNPSLHLCRHVNIPDAQAGTTGQSSQGLRPGTWAPGQVLKSPASLETHVPSQKVEKQATALREEGALGLCVCLGGAPG